MRDLDEDASVESLKEKNQKVSNLLRKTTQLNILQGVRDAWEDRGDLEGDEGACRLFEGRETSDGNSALSTGLAKEAAGKDEETGSLEIIHIHSAS